MMVTVPVMAARRAKLKPAMPLPMTRKLETRSITLLLAPRPANRLTGEGRFHRITNYDLFPHIFYYILLFFFFFFFFCVFFFFFFFSVCQVCMWANSPRGRRGGGLRSSPPPATRRTV